MGLLFLFNGDDDGDRHHRGGIDVVVVEPQVNGHIAKPHSGTPSAHCSKYYNMHFVWARLMLYFFFCKYIPYKAKHFNGAFALLCNVRKIEQPSLLVECNDDCSMHLMYLYLDLKVFIRIGWIVWKRISQPKPCVCVCFKISCSI